jgi:hypothetical protein
MGTDKKRSAYAPKHRLVRFSPEIADLLIAAEQGFLPHRPGMQTRLDKDIEDINSFLYGAACIIYTNAEDRLAPFLNLLENETVKEKLAKYKAQNQA